MRDFTWVDGERTIHFGRGVAAEAVDALGGPGYTLLTTERASSAAPWIAMAAGAVHVVPGGPRRPHRRRPARRRSTRRPARRARRRARDRRDEGAGRRGWRPRDGRPDDAVGRRDDPRAPARARRRRVDAARAARGRRLRPGAGRLAARAPSSPRARSTRSATRSRAPCTVRANPVATLAAHEAARLLARGWSGARARPRHARARRAARRLRDRLDRPRRCTTCSPRRSCAHAGIGHGPANAAMLPHTIGALAWRFPDRIEALGDAVGEDLAELALRIRARTGAGGLRDLGVDPRRAAASAPTPRPRARSSPTRRPPPTAPRSSLSTRARSDPAGACGNSDYRGLVRAEPVDEAESTCRTFSGNRTRALGPGRRWARWTSRCARRCG